MRLYSEVPSAVAKDIESSSGTRAYLADSSAFSKRRSASGQAAHPAEIPRSIRSVRPCFRPREKVPLSLQDSDPSSVSKVPGATVPASSVAKGRAARAPSHSTMAPVATIIRIRIGSFSSRRTPACTVLRDGKGHHARIDQDASPASRLGEGRKDRKSVKPCRCSIAQSKRRSRSHRFCDSTSGRSPGSEPDRPPSRDLSQWLVNDQLRRCRVLYSGWSAADSHGIPGQAGTSVPVHPAFADPMASKTYPLPRLSSMDFQILRGSFPLFFPGEMRCGQDRLRSAAGPSHQYDFVLSLSI